MLERTREALAAFRVERFDHWTFESELYAGHPSLVESTIATLTEAGRTYTDDGALWLRTTEFGDDKDRVLIRSNGEHTYFASDIAYHQSRRERGYEHQIDVWGADHHGYLLRMKAVYAALGGDPDDLELLIMQLVHLVRGGERAQMSKRAGEFVTLQELVEEIGVDAARWYLLARSHDTTVDLDLDLAREQSAENPVYYVQYAHARIASIVAKAGEGAPEGGAGGGRQPPEFAPAPLRAEPDRAAAGVPGRAGRGERTAGSPPAHGVRARAGPELHRLLPRLPGIGGRALRARVAAVGPLGGGPDDDRPLPGPARGDRAGAHVGEPLQAAAGGRPASRIWTGRRPDGRRRRR